jgi:transposase-like protein
MKSAIGSAEARWRAVVEEQRTSGLTVAAFCSTRGIAASSLYDWRRRLASPASSMPTFLEVSTRGSRPEPAPSIELELRDNGRRVLILRRDFDPTLLRDVLAALEGEATPTHGEAR